VTAPVYAEGGRLDDVTRMQLVDLYTRLRGDVLVKADRLAMAHGLRLRAPFLDPDVFAVAATVPTELRVPQRTPETKVALRRAVAGLVPEAVANRRRRAVSTPIATWLRGDLGEWSDELLRTSSAGDLIDLGIVRGYLDAHRRGEADHARKVWTVLVFCVWHAVFVTGSLTPVMTDRQS
jgi:asparagine synthase (glutamine-hydrolysing)